MLASKLCVDAVDVKGKRVFLRVDYNVPLNKQTGAVEDDSRIVASLPTIRYLLDGGAKSIVLASHLGRPDGKPNKKMSLKPIAPVVQKLLKHPVKFVPECVGKEVEAACANPPAGSVFLLENLRFHAEEEGAMIDTAGKIHKAPKEKVAAFRASLSALCDVYVNDAFGTVHRAHSSITGVVPKTPAGVAPVRAGGLLIKAELKAFSVALESPARPYTAILGGAKVADKIQLINNLLDKVDNLIIGGGMAYTFLKVAHDYGIGDSLYDAAGAKTVAQLMAKAKAKGVNLLLPLDHIVSNKLAAVGCDIRHITYPADPATVTATTSGPAPAPAAAASAAAGAGAAAGGASGIPAGFMGVDIGPLTVSRNAQVIWNSKTVVFNGPMGVFEYPAFSAGTMAALQACAAASQLRSAVTIIGGGDTASAANKFGFASLVTHVSTGGGASLELLEGKDLPGITSLTAKPIASKL